MSLEQKSGIFILILLVVAVFLIFSRGRLSIFKGGYGIGVSFDFVGGLETGGPVRVSGVRVGEVKDIKIVYEKEKLEVLVRLWLKKDVKLGQGSQVFIRSLGLIGEKYVEILPAPPTALPLIKNGDIVKGIDPIPMEKYFSLGEDITRNLNKIIVSAQEFISDKRLKNSIINTAEEIEGLAAKGRIFISEAQSLLSEGKKSLDGFNQLLKENRENLSLLLSNSQEAASNLKETSAKATQILEKISSGEGTLGALLQDKEIYENLKTTIAKFEIMAQNLERMTNEIDEIIAHTKSGEGTVGKLFYSEEIHNEIKSLIQEIKTHPWRLLRPPRGEK